MVIARFRLSANVSKCKSRIAFIGNDVWPLRKWSVVSAQASCTADVTGLKFQFRLICNANSRKKAMLMWLSRQLINCHASKQRQRGKLCGVMIKGPRQPMAFERCTLNFSRQKYFSLTTLHFLRSYDMVHFGHANALRQVSTLCYNLN